MKLGTITAMAALAVAMTLGANVTPADAGQKGKHANHGNSAGKVHIDPKVSSDKLRALSHKLKGHQKQAVREEIERRGRIHDEKKQGKVTGKGIGSIPDIEEQIIHMGLIGVEYGKRRKGGH